MKLLRHVTKQLHGLISTLVSPVVSTALMKVLPRGVTAHIFNSGLLRASCHLSDAREHLAFFMASSNGYMNSADLRYS